MTILPCPAKAQEYVSVDDSREYTTYVIKWYEDLSEVAQAFGVSEEDILRYNGLESAREAKKVKTIKIPKKGVALPQQRPETARADTTAAAAAPEEGTFIQKVEDAAERIDSIFEQLSPEAHMALVMPFTGEGQSDSYYDFYSGVLMAVRDLGQTGVKTDLSVFDYNEDGERLQKTDLNGFDFILGPVSKEQLESVVRITPERTVVVSPLDPKGFSIADSCSHFIQAPTAADRQYEDAVEWLKADLQPGDKVILMKESKAAAHPMEQHMTLSGMEYKEICYDILEGRDIAGQMEKIAEGGGVLRAVISSENEAFVNDAVRNLNLMTFRGYAVELYSTSKMRNFSTIEAEAFHNVNLHMSTTYFINYDSDRIKNFLLTYRALFECEPGPFAYQGYDITSCLLSTRYQYRSAWKRELEGITYRGLQTSFRFGHDGGKGLTNHAVRRVIYGKDFSITEKY